MLHAAGYKGGPLRDLKREGRTASGRVYSLRIPGLVPDQITAQDFRTIVGRSLGWSLIKSTAFTVKRTGNGFRFDGQGFGHGVGLCVLGSVGRRRARRFAEGDPRGVFSRPEASPDDVGDAAPGHRADNARADDRQRRSGGGRRNTCRTHLRGWLPLHRLRRPPLRWASPLTVATCGT